MWNIIEKKNINILRNKIDSQFTENGESVFPENEYIFHETDKFYILPRYIHHYIKDPMIISKNNMKRTQPENIIFTKTLKPEQQLIMDEFDLVHNKKGILVARPGFGKTVIGSYLSSVYNRKTAIIIDNSKLLEQWIDAYISFTNVTMDQISIIRGDDFEIENKKIFIIMVQTLASKLKRNFEYYFRLLKSADIDLVLYDETHETGSSPKWSATTIFFETENLFGLTATPKPSRLQNQLLLKFSIGDVLVKNTDYELQTEYVFKFFSSNFIFNYYLLNKLIKNNYIFGKTKYNELVHNDKEYLDSILSICKKESQIDHIILIIVKTIKQLESIHEYLTSNNLSPKKFYSKDKIVDKKETKILIATSKMASKGFDFKELSCLILANPMKSKNQIIQTVGRIGRTKEDNVNSPKVYDLIDSRIFEFVEEKSYKMRMLKEEFKSNITFTSE